jgi:virginiamycin B lyase
VSDLRASVPLLAALLLAAPAARAVRITEFPLGAGPHGPQRIVSGHDGRLWFCEASKSYVGAITTAGVVTEYGPLPFSSHASAAAPVVKDTAVWFRITSDFLAYVLPNGSLTPVSYSESFNESGLVFGPDGWLWVSRSSSLVRYAYYSLDMLQSATLPQPASPQRLAVGADGRIWYAGSSTNKVGACAPDGGCVDYTLPVTMAPFAITAGPDGNLWVNATSGDTPRIARVTTAGVVTPFPLPTAQAGDLAGGPDGNVWFTVPAANKIGRITPSGDVKEWPVPTAASSPSGIALGPDGNLWFTELLGEKIGRLEPFVSGDTNGSGVIDVQDVFVLINFLFAGGPAPQ